MKHITFATCILGISLLGCDSATDPIGASGAASSTPSGGGATAPITLPDTGVNSSGKTPTPGATPTADANCGMQTTDTSKAPADVLLVLDRSGSMQESIADDCCCTAACRQAISIKMCANTTACTERWPALTEAVGATIAKTTGINWGLKLFSSPSGNDACGVSASMEAGFGSNATLVQSQIANANPKNSTPTAKAIAAATAYLKTVNDPNSKAILLATDGEPNCKTGSSDLSTPDVDGTKAAIQAALAAGFRVYVIGIGPSVGNLDTFAAAGGTNRYYRATSATELADALTSVSHAVSSCTFTMAQSPPDPDNIVVYLDGKLVPKEPSNGWSAGTTPLTITLNGTSCQTITSGAATNVRILFGCPGENPPPILF